MMRAGARVLCFLRASVVRDICGAAEDAGSTRRRLEAKQPVRGHRRGQTIDRSKERCGATSDPRDLRFGGSEVCSFEGSFGGGVGWGGQPNRFLSKKKVSCTQ
jgi:hypothetical protein